MGLGGHLATINDDAEQNFVFSTFGSYGGVNRSLWIGLNDAAQEGNFVWVSGETPSYTHWLPGQPGNNGDEDYVHMLRTGNAFQVTPGDWNDLASPNSPFYSAFSPIEGVVETVPEPSALVMLGSGIIGAIVIRRRGLAARLS
jgi:Lectin C-type domain/PEP-CTERM motif